MKWNRIYKKWQLARAIRKKEKTTREPLRRRVWNHPSSRRARTVTKHLAKAVLVFHLLTQVGHWSNTAYHRMNPSRMRQQFEQAFHTQLRGWGADIENEPELITAYANIIEREYRTRPFTFNSLVIEPAEYWKQNMAEQLVTIFKTYRMGHYERMWRKIGLSNHLHDSDAESVLRHEIKHHKIYDVVEKHPEFEREWKKLVLDEHGQSMYLSKVAQTVSNFRLIHRLVKRNNNEKINHSLGFISNYARTNFHEDAAELCEYMEYDGNYTEKNEIIQDKNKNPECVRR